MNSNINKIIIWLVLAMFFVFTMSYCLVFDPGFVLVKGNSIKVFSTNPDQVADVFSVPYLVGSFVAFLVIIVLWMLIAAISKKIATFFVDDYSGSYSSDSFSSLLLAGPVIWLIFISQIGKLFRELISYKQLDYLTLFVMVFSLFVSDIIIRKVWHKNSAWYSILSVGAFYVILIILHLSWVSMWAGVPIG